RPPAARGAALGLRHQFDYFTALGRIQLVEPAAQPAIFRQRALQFIRLGDHPLFGIWLQPEMRSHSRPSAAASLHPLVDQQIVVAFAGGKQRGAKREAVDLAFNTKLAAFAPKLMNFEGNAKDDPLERRLHSL